MGVSKRHFPGHVVARSQTTTGFLYRLKLLWIVLASMAIARKLGYELEGMLKAHDTYAAADITCRDHALWGRVSLEGLPELEVSW